MSIDHCGLDTPVAQEILDRSNVVTVFEQMCSEGIVPERMASGPFRQTRPCDCYPLLEL
jgi:hypothetical protein